MASSFSIAHVTPYPWEAQENEVNAYVERVTSELSQRGHRVLVLAPSRSQERVRASRKELRALRAQPESLLEATDQGTPRVIAVGEVLDVPSSARRRTSALSIDVARTVEEVLTTVELDFVHVHEPFAPSTSNAALRHSRALNVGSFHAPNERLLSTLVARRFVESFFGRLDARTASLPATAELMAKHFPGEYRLVPDGDGATAQLQEIYDGLAARRHPLGGDPALARRLAERPLIEVDLHMHTDHSGDRARAGAGRDRGDRSQRDLRGARGPRAGGAARSPPARQGDRRRGGQDRRSGRGDRSVHRGEDPPRPQPRGDRRGDQAPGGPRLRAASLRPHALGARLRAPADDHRRRRRDRGLQPARGDRRVQRGGLALRRQVSNPRGRRLGLARRPGPRFGPHQDARLRRAAGVPAVAAWRRHPHAPIFAALRAGAEVPADPRHPRIGAPRAQGAPPEAPAAHARKRWAEVAKAQLLVHRQGQDDASSNPSGSMPVTDDEIREKYLERAIRELNTLTRELQACPHCPRGNLMPVLGSGHPQADIMLLKYSALPSEIEEGVAFYGRAGGALMKSLKRLSIDPLAVYGTLCVKCPLSDASLADFACVSRVVEEIAIVAPKIIVVMGAEALGALNDMQIPLARPLTDTLGEVQPLTPTIDALYVPNIDDSLDEQDAKRDFWAAFRSLGDWYVAQPPY